MSPGVAENNRAGNRERLTRPVILDRGRKLNREVGERTVKERRPKTMMSQVDCAHASG